MTQEICDLATLRCRPCEGGTPPLTQAEAQSCLEKLSGWEMAAGRISRTFEFKNYYHTMAFVNAVAWIAHAENHHPDLEVSYRACKVFFSTHAVSGLSENDFICAAKVNALLPAT